MIRRLTENDEQLVLDFAYKRERENIFVIGSFRTYDNTLKENHFWGYFENNKLIGMATHFHRWKSVVCNAQDPDVIEQLTDEVVLSGLPIHHVPCFKRYTDVMICRLEQQHGIKAKKVSQEDVLILEQKNFVNFTMGGEEVANTSDKDELILFDRRIHGNALETPIEENERERINVKETVVLRTDGKIVAKANIHGYSKNYFQIGGVGTLQEYRGKGYGKRVVSQLCEQYFAKGIPYALLFTEVENIPAQKIYASLGFQPEDHFLIAEYKSMVLQG